MRATVEGCHCLDVNELHREGSLKPGVTCHVSWTRVSDATVIASVSVAATQGELRLHYALREPDGEAEEISYVVRLTHTGCNYGGQRPWFVCPGVVHGVPCGRRVGKLYNRGRYFVCRHCHELAYESQRRGAAARLWATAADLRHRLGQNGVRRRGWAQAPLPPPMKPPGMHQNTYVRTLDRIEMLEWEADQIELRAATQFLERSRRPAW